MPPFRGRGTDASTGLGILATSLSFVKFISAVGYDADVAIGDGSDAHHAHKLYLCSAATIQFITRWAANVAIVLQPRGGMKCDPFPIQSSD